MLPMLRFRLVPSLVVWLPPPRLRSPAVVVDSVLHLHRHSSSSSSSSSRWYRPLVDAVTKQGRRSKQPPRDERAAVRVSSGAMRARREAEALAAGGGGLVYPDGRIKHRLIPTHRPPTASLGSPPSRTRRTQRALPSPPPPPPHGLSTSHVGFGTPSITPAPRSRRKVVVSYAGLPSVNASVELEPVAFKQTRPVEPRSTTPETRVDRLETAKAVAEQPVVKALERARRYDVRRVEGREAWIDEQTRVERIVTWNELGDAVRRLGHAAAREQANARGGTTSGGAAWAGRFDLLADQHARLVVERGRGRHVGPRRPSAAPTRARFFADRACTNVYSVAWTDLERVSPTGAYTRGGIAELERVEASKAKAVDKLFRDLTRQRHAVQ
ncbi:hypothetical protein JCM11491_006184 [Sporobolomyces phaffii]